MAKGGNKNNGYTIKPTTTTEPVTVTLDNFIRAETDMYFGKAVEDGGFGKLWHRRQMAEIDKQDDGRGPVELEREPAVIDRIE